jgi:hypothetical protein
MTLPFPSARSECRQTEALLPPYVDGEAAPPARAAVEAHLATCADCRALALAQREVRALLVSRRQRLVDPAPEGLSTDVRREVRTATLPAPRPRWTAVAAAAGVVLAVSGGFVWATGQSSVLLAAQLTLDHLKCFIIDGDDRADGLTPASGQAHFHDDFGMDVALPVPTADGRAKLVSVRQCLYGEGWIAHALYRVDGEEVSLFVLSDRHDATAIDAFGRHAEVVVRGARSFVVVAPSGVPQVARALGLGAE